MLRNDSAVGASALPPEEVPPRLAADEQPIPSEVLARDRAEDRRSLPTRLDNFERVKRAEQKLLDLEERIEASLPPDTGEGR